MRKSVSIWVCICRTYNRNALSAFPAFLGPLNCSMEFFTCVKRLSEFMTVEIVTLMIGEAAWEAISQREFPGTQTEIKLTHLTLLIVWSQQCETPMRKLQQLPRGYSACRARWLSLFRIECCCSFAPWRFKMLVIGQTPTCLNTKWFAGYWVIISDHNKWGGLTLQNPWFREAVWRREAFWSADTSKISHFWQEVSKKRALWGNNCKSTHQVIRTAFLT